MASPALPNPEPAVVAPSAPEPTPASKESETDFAAILDAADADGPPTVPAPAQPEPPPDLGVAPPATGDVPAAPQPPPTDPKVEPPPTVPLPEPAKPPVVDSPPATPEVPSAPAPQPMTEEQLKAKRTELVEAFSSCYKLTEEDEAALVTEPNKVLPRLAGNIAADVFEATVRVITQQIPVLVQQQLQGNAAAEQARKAFFAEFPQLDKPEYLPVIRQVTQMYRQMNPNAPYADAMKAIGRHASVMLNVASAAGPSPVVAPVAQPPKPAAPLMPNAAPVVHAPNLGNVFDELARFELIDG